MRLRWSQASGSFGPLPAAVPMSEFGCDRLFLYTAVIHGSMALFILYRITRQEVPADRDKDGFASLPWTSPTVFAVDPRDELVEGKSGDDGEATSA